MAEKVDLASVPEVMGWLSLPQVAERLGVSRQYASRMAARGRFTTLSRIGTYLVVNVWEVSDMTRQDKSESV